MTVASDAADNISGAFDESWASPEAEKSAYRYKVFISYRHADGDRQLAQWLHSSIETYRTPRGCLVGACERCGMASKKTDFPT